MAPEQAMDMEGEDIPMSDMLDGLLTMPIMLILLTDTLPSGDGHIPPIPMMGPIMSIVHQFIQTDIALLIVQDQELGLKLQGLLTKKRPHEAFF